MTVTAGSISRDGQHLFALMNATEAQTGTLAEPQIQVVLNWFEELKAKAPTAP